MLSDLVLFVAMWHVSWTEDSAVWMEVPWSLIHYTVSQSGYIPSRSACNKSLYCHDHSDINTLSVFNITINTTKSMA